MHSHPNRLRSLAPAGFSTRPKVFYVHIAPQPALIQQVPPGVMIVVVDNRAVAVPFPIAAAIEVVVATTQFENCRRDHAASP